MSKINNVLELNGKRYDSQTGAFIGSNGANTALGNQSPQGRRVQSLDGFMPAPAPKPAKQELAVIPVAKQPSKDAMERASRRATKPVNAHTPERSKTLMRHTVKAPVVKSNRVESLQAPTDLIKTQPRVIGVKPKLSSEVVDSDRALRASNVSRSNQVVRFKRQKVNASSAAVAAAPAVRIAAPAEITKPVPEVAPAPTPQKDVFERAIDTATSHEEPAHDEGAKRKARRGVRRHARWVSITAIVFAAVLLGGFITYQNKIELQLQLASAKAGFPATMPGFHPVGYSAKSLTYSPGKVAIGYAGPNDKSYKVVQKTSNWDSQTLLENFVATSGQPYDAYKASGRTVYVYGNGNATWVSGGVWYQVNDNGTLSKDQIIELANSM